MRQSGSSAIARGLLVVLGLAAALSSGCTPTCKATCKKLLDCGEGIDTPRASQDDCEYACEVQRDLYEENWEDAHLSEEFDDMRSCIADSECADIADGVCYDDELYTW